MCLTFFRWEVEVVRAETFVAGRETWHRRRVSFGRALLWDGDQCGLTEGADGSRSGGREVRAADAPDGLEGLIFGHGREEVLE